MANIILLAQDPAHASATNLTAALQGNGHAVTVAAAANYDQQDYDQYDLILLARVDAGGSYTAGLVSTIRSRLDGGQPVGIGLTDYAIGSNETNVTTLATLIGLAGLGFMSPGAAVDEITIVDNAEGLPTEGLPLGEVQIYTANNFDMVVDSMAGTVLAVSSTDHAAADQNLPSLGIVEAGTPYNGGANTTGARCFLYSALYCGQSGYTAEGSQLLENLVQWALGAGTQIDIDRTVPAGWRGGAEGARALPASWRSSIRPGAALPVAARAEIASDAALPIAWGETPPDGAVLVAYAEAEAESAAQTSIVEHLSAPFTAAPNGRYAFLSSAMLNGNSTTAEAHADSRFADDGGATEMTLFDAAVESASDWLSVGGVGYIEYGPTPPASTRALFRYGGRNGAAAKVRNARLAVLRLGPNDAGSFSQAETALGGDTDWHAAPGALVLSVPSQGDYLILASCLMAPQQSSPGHVGARLNIDSGAAIVAEMEKAPHRGFDVHSWAAMTRRTLSAGQHTIAVEGKVFNAGDDCNIGRSVIVAIRIDDLPDGRIFYADATAPESVAGGGGAFADLAAPEVVQTTAAGEHLVLGHAIFGGDDGALANRLRIAQDGAGQATHEEEPVDTGALGFVYWTIGRETLSAGPHSWTLQAANGGANETTVGDRAIAVIPLFASGVVPVDSDHALSAAWFATTVRDRAFPTAFLGTASAARTMPFAARAEVAAARSMPADWLAGLASDAPIPIGWKAAVDVEADAPLPISWAASLDAHASIPAEWRLALETGAALPAAWRAAVARSADIPAAWRAELAAAAPTPVAWRAGVAADRTAPIEWRASVAAVRALPAAWAGALGVFAVRALPIAWRNLVAADADLAALWRRQAAALRTAPVGWLTSVAAAAALPIDTAQIVTVAAPLPAAWRGLLEIDRTAFARWLAEVVPPGQTVPADWLAAVVIDPTLPVRWTAPPVDFVLGNPDVWIAGPRGTVWRADARSLRWIAGPRGTTWTGKLT
ncbi:MAG TPA: hypothetical protein VF188_09205 [Longimicrobiales bacterium]